MAAISSGPKTRRHEIDQEYVYNGMVMLGRLTPRSDLDRIQDYEMTGDVMIASYPKTGSTWLSEILWLVKNDADFTKAKTSLVGERVPYLETVDVSGQPTLDKLATAQSSRIFKTHLPTSFFQKQLHTGGLKVIMPVRNPKDTLVSLYHFYRMHALLGNYTGTWNEFYQELVSPGHLLYGNFFDWYASWLDAKPSENILFVKYEDMTKDLASEIWKIAKFLDVELAEDKVSAIAKHCSFGAMKNNAMTNYTLYSTVLNQDISPFMRKGKVGDWKNYFTEEQSREIDQIYKDVIEPRGLNLEFEIE